MSRPVPVDKPLGTIMALFTKERDRVQGARPPGVVQPVPDPAPPEVEMFDRERDKVQLDDPSQISAFLGKGTRVTGKLAFEGPGRIEGHVEGEVSAQDTLIIG